MADQISINQLVVAVVASEDFGELAQLLIRNKYYFTRVTSYGGILSDEMVSVLIGIDSARHRALLELISGCCHTRTKYVSAGDNPILQGHRIMIEAEVGGATIYTFEVEQFVQL
jgi:uncharacterized protein YaaQ